MLNNTVSDKDNVRLGFSIKQIHRTGHSVNSCTWGIHIAILIDDIISHS